MAKGAAHELKSTKFSTCPKLSTDVNIFADIWIIQDLIISNRWLIFTSRIPTSSKITFWNMARLFFIFVIFFQNRYPGSIFEVIKHFSRWITEHPYPIHLQYVLHPNCEKCHSNLKEKGSARIMAQCMPWRLFRNCKVLCPPDSHFRYWKPDNCSFEEFHVIPK